MAENKDTPIKISAKNPVCRFCFEPKERRCVIQIFYKPGLTQELMQKVKLSCGICISENDTKSKVLCRSCLSTKCVTLLEKYGDCKTITTTIYVNLKYARILGISRSRDRPIPGPFPQSPSKRNALGTRL